MRIEKQAHECSHHGYAEHIRRSARGGSDAWCAVPPVAAPGYHRLPGWRFPPERPLLPWEEPDRNGRPGPIWRRATAPGRSTPSASACCAVVIRGAFARSGFRTPHRVHRIPPRDLW